MNAINIENCFPKQFVYGCEYEADKRQHWENHVAKMSKEAREKNLRIGSQEHHDYVFGSYVPISN